MPLSDSSGTDEPITMDQMRRLLVDAVSAYSEMQWCAGWLVGIERIIREEGRAWVVLAYLAGGWPIGVDGEDGWAPLTADEKASARAYLASLGP
jgi:hypothetical protein